MRLTARTTRAAVVFAAAFAWFSLRASLAWLASGYVDPVGHFGTQDEAFYSRVVIEMLRRGDWLTPTLLDRIAYFKPPLLYWLSAVSVSTFGPGRYAFRLPSVLAAAGICALAFHLIDRRRGPWIALLAAVVLAGDGYLIMLGSLNMTDAPAAFFALLAMWTLACDPQLARPRDLALCAAALAAAVLTKSVAGLLPAAAIAVYWVTGASVVRPSARRIISLAALILALAAPWFLYALATHGRWFWTEHVLTELLNGAKGNNPLSTTDPNIIFYGQRFFRGDPVTAAVCTAGLIIAIAWRRGDRLFAMWLAVTAVSLMLFRQHAAAYLLPFIVAAVIVSALAMPNLKSRNALAVALLLIACEAGYAVRLAPIVWTGTANPQAVALTAYCDLRRGNGLMIVDPDDEYYSAVLPLPRVQYAMVERGRAAARQPIDWRWLGVIVTADQFAHQAGWWEIFRQRLNAFGLRPELDPRATIVLLPPENHGEETQAETLVATHPELDFYVPANWISGVGGHDAWAAAAGRVWLLSRQPKARIPMQIAGRAWACTL